MKVGARKKFEKKGAEKGLCPGIRMLREMLQYNLLVLGWWMWEWMVAGKEFEWWERHKSQDGVYATRCLRS